MDGQPEAPGYPLGAATSVVGYVCGSFRAGRTFLREPPTSSVEPSRSFVEWSKSSVDHSGSFVGQARSFVERCGSSVGQARSFVEHCGSSVGAIGERRAEVRAVQALAAARDAAQAAEWALHEGILGAKSQVIPQYGPDSNAMQLLG